MRFRRGPYCSHAPFMTASPRSFCRNRTPSSEPRSPPGGMTRGRGWHRARAFALLGLQNLAEADLAHALALAPDRSGDWLLWVECGRFFTQHDRPRMAAAAVAKADGLTCDNPDLLMIWGREFAESGDWARAAAAFGRAFELRPDDLLAGHLWAVLARHADGAPRYRRACTRVLERFGQTSDPATAGFLVFTLIQDPDAVADWEAVIRLAEKPVAQWPQGGAWQYELGGAYLRSGRFEQALKTLDQADRLEPEWQSHILIDLLKAIVHLRLGDERKARPFLVRANDWCDRHLKPGPGRPFGDWSEGLWWDWFAVQALCAEAESLLTRSYRDLPMDVLAPESK